MNTGGRMQIKNENTVIERAKCSVQSNGEYRIDKGIYNVNRVFTGEKTIKEIIFQKLTCDYSVSHN